MARTRNEAAHAATRQRILRAAEALFAERGFHGTGMAAICEAVGMSPGTLYRYFASKDAIIVAFVEEELAESIEGLKRLEDAPDVLAALVDVLDASLSWGADPAYVAVATEVVAEASRNQAIGERVAAMQHTLFRTLADALSRAQAGGSVAAEVDVEAAAAALLALVDGAVATGSVMGSLDPQRRRSFLDRLVKRVLGASRP
ncbi:MAG: helix-turn-helix domain-containing protein [Myxococcota bacterium]